MCLRCLEKVKQYSPKWSFNGDLPWYKRKSHLKIIQVDEDFEPPNPKNHHKNPDHSLPNMVPRIRNKAFESSFIRDGPILAAAQCQSLQSLHCMSPETKSSISNPLLGSFPYHSHTTSINSWKFMGSLWEPYGTGVPFFGGTWTFPLLNITNKNRTR